ncbi:MAG: hypothetical protein AW09_001922 [Candidatus Accumulibacter phosphatis]|uniref:Uncharacterized protein n=1 Tax=Candidatus Accumulibacter phosphatis TaxID=327160 RepID=A0A080LVW5_9PROT|nr:MAG: hypothetical protein AW09_001922 [Candidatus Accumulibacter phosphatis]
MAAEVGIEVQRYQPRRHRSLRLTGTRTLDQHIIRQFRRAAPGLLPVSGVNLQAPEYVEHPLAELQFRFSGDEHPLVRALQHTQTFRAQLQHSIRMSGTQLAAGLDATGSGAQAAGIDPGIEQQGARQRLQLTLKG